MGVVDKIKNLSTMIKKVISIVLMISVITKTFSYVTFFNASSRQTLIIGHAIETKDSTSTTWLTNPNDKIPAIAPQSVYIDKNIKLKKNQILYIQRVLADTEIGDMYPKYVTLSLFSTQDIEKLQGLFERIDYNDIAKLCDDAEKKALPKLIQKIENINTEQDDYSKIELNKTEYRILELLPYLDPTKDENFDDKISQNLFPEAFMQFPAGEKIPNRSSCYIANNNDGVIFYVFEKQGIITCTRSTGVTPEIDQNLTDSL